MIKKQQTQRSQNRDQTVDHYAGLHQSFAWQVPEYFNMAEVCCRRWAQPGSDNQDTIKKVAIYAHKQGVAATS